jgi:hypothetical protein
MARNNSTELIEELLRTIDRVGLRKTIQGLKDTTNPLNSMEVLQEYIILTICLEFKISKQFLLTGRKNAENRANAIGVACLMLRDHCKLTQTEIARTIRKDNSNVNKYLKKYENLDPNFKKDLDLINIISILNNKIITFNNNLNG